MPSGWIGSAMFGAGIAAWLITGVARAGAPAACGPGPDEEAGYALNPALLELPKGRWVEIHRQRPGDAVTFVRQAHGGSAFDTRRGRLVLFGSDTHATGDWTNAPLIFDLARLEWRRAYPDDGPETYAVSRDGIPVAGAAGSHPWAMHTFGALSYDPSGDAVIVASYPQHMAPGRFTEALAPLWPKVGRHPTWVLRLESETWAPAAGDPVHFFPYATAFDSHRCVTLGYRASGIYEFALATGRWRKAAHGGLLEWGNNAVYDARHRVLVSVGPRAGRASVAVYDPASGRHRLMPTPGVRPDRARYLPLAYHPDLDRTVAVVDRAVPGKARGRAGLRAETWLYDLSGDAWTRLEGARLPFGVGMNYNLEFDPGHRLLLLVADPPGGAVAVWALRL